MDEELSAKLPGADFRPAAPGAGIGVIMALERKLEAALSAFRFHCGIQVRFHGTESKSTKSTLLELDES
jgi:hypothetical protein